MERRVTPVRFGAQHDRTSSGTVPHRGASSRAPTCGMGRPSKKEKIVDEDASGDSSCDRATPPKWYDCNPENRDPAPSASIRRGTSVVARPRRGANERSAATASGNARGLDRLWDIFSPHRKVREIEREITALERELRIRPDRNVRDLTTRLEAIRMQVQRRTTAPAAPPRPIHTPWNGLVGTDARQSRGVGERIQKTERRASG